MADIGTDYGQDSNQTTPQPEPSAQQEPASQPQPASPYASQMQSHRSTAKILVAIIVVILVIAIAVYASESIAHKKVVVTTTTLAPRNLSNINNCTTISKPGDYYLISSIFTKERNGSCINITAGNVVLYGNSNLIKGSGPYAIVPPYSYGIRIGPVSNVSVKDLGVDSFSYGVFVDNSTNATLSDVNASNDTMSGIYLYRAHNTLLENSAVSKASSKQGGISIVLGGNNKLVGDSSAFNLYTGVGINSTNNTFEKDTFLNNPVDIMCGSIFGFKRANAFANSSCNVNFYCDFASCKKTNLPTNITQIRLLPGKISTCGLISQPGNYSLASGINMARFLNLSNPLARRLSCIKINASDVRLDCGGRSIENAGTGVQVSGPLNDQVFNCTFNNDTYAVKVANTYNANISDISVQNSTYGIYLSNVTSGTISSIYAHNGTFGIYSNSSTGLVLSNLALRDNAYGIFMRAGSGDAFNGGNVTGNFKVDAYCSPSTYNSTSNLFQNINCGVTDCNWASCKSHVLPQLSMYPVSSCQQISHPGNYSLTQNLVASPGCFDIATSNVVFNCNNKTLTGPGYGYAFALSNVSNVTIVHCTITHFDYGVQLYNASAVSLDALGISSVKAGVYGKGVFSSDITGVYVSGYSEYGLGFNNVNGSSIQYDAASNGASNATGFMFNGAHHNMVEFDNSQINPAYGFAFVNFTNNTVYNNTAFSNKKLDYYCSYSSSGIYANQNGINSGDTKNTCRWLLVLPTVSENPPCAAVSSSSYISLASDMLYSTGTTCYNIYNTNSSSANYTTINCNGHTVLATSGGTFVNVVNASRVKLENCFIKGFDNAFVSHGAGSQVINNTIIDTSHAVMLTGANQSVIANNRLSNDTYAIVAKRTSLASVLNNTFSSVQQGITWINGSASKFYYNNVSNSAYGLQLFNTTSDLAKDNVFETSNYGVACYGTAENSSSANLDLGNNVCSSNHGCGWMSSPSCKPA
ncbi:MAG: NosD domain-containing protein [Candidatus Micrarchaeia archaeon]